MYPLSQFISDVLMRGASRDSGYLWVTFGCLHDSLVEMLIYDLSCYRRLFKFLRTFLDIKIQM